MTRVSDSELLKLKEAALYQGPVEGLTHRHYKYPARFSPTFVAAAIEALSKPGDLVLDPYAGGGTTLVEGMASGRQVVGCDVNSLALFVARVKTRLLAAKERRAIETWAREVVPRLSYHAMPDKLSEVICETRTRNLNLPRARAIKKLIALCILTIDELASHASQEFARCALLSVGQWALNGRRKSVSAPEFREKLVATTIAMLASADAFALCAAKSMPPVLIEDSAERLIDHSPFSDGRKVDLVVTSPPYPGVHVLYHRWQVDGRRETPAAYWIADCLDGHGASYYNFGGRSSPDLDGYFEASLRTLRGIRKVMRNGAFLAQMLAFSKPAQQLPRYLENMKSAGFVEVVAKDGQAARTWRAVPGRSWHANLMGRTSGANEIALLHVASDDA